MNVYWLLMRSIFTYSVPTLHQAIVKAVPGVSGICATCSFFADSTAKGCVIELKNI